MSVSVIISVNLIDCLDQAGCSKVKMADSLAVIFWAGTHNQSHEC